MSLTELIAEAIRLKEGLGGNTEFMLYYWGDGEWSAEIGNRSRNVNLGEIGGDYESRDKDRRCHKIPEDAVSQLIENLKNGAKA
jgi:hypothetical protein